MASDNPWESLSDGDEPANSRGPARTPGEPESAGADAEIDSLALTVSALMEQAPASRTWRRNLFAFVVSLILFVASGFLKFDAQDLGILVAAVFIHELGHYLAMRWFGYRDVGMFFLPFIGGAAAGRRQSPSGSQEGLVLLAGPLPGIVIGAGLGVWSLRNNVTTAQNASLLFLALNAFNLLPILPLDGGRLLHVVVFSRHRFLELAFRGGAGLLLVGTGVAVGDWICVGFGALILMNARTSFQNGTVASEIRRSREGSFADALETPAVAALDDIPLENVKEIVRRLVARAPSLRDPRTLLISVRDVWERLQTRAPGPIASTALLSLYFLGIVGGVGATLVVVLSREPYVRIQETVDANGSHRQQQVTYLRLRPILIRDVGAGGLFDGAHLEFFPDGDATHVTGQWKAGRWDGDWLYFDETGHEQAHVHFREGRLISYLEATSEGWKSRSLKETPEDFQIEYSSHLQDAPEGIVDPGRR